MLSIKEVRSLGARLSPDQFKKQLGPFVLVQRPPREEMQEETTRIARPQDIQVSMLSLIFEFEDLSVANLPPVQGATELTVGRLGDCDLAIEGDGSVSKRHAVLKWDETKKACSVQDLGSTNGTFLNGGAIAGREVALRDGDIISFGNAQFWFLLTDTLQGKLNTQSQARKLGSHSG